LVPTAERDNYINQWVCRSGVATGGPVYTLDPADMNNVWAVGMTLIGIGSRQGCSTLSDGRCAAGQAVTNPDSLPIRCRSASGRMFVKIASRPLSRPATVG
jgi:hypothetical protein